MATHARTTEKPDPRRVSRWRESMDRADRERVRVDRRPAAGRARVRDRRRPRNRAARATERHDRPATARLAPSDLDGVAAPPPDREPKRPPAPFVVGVNRSGTTLLRMMLDAHPELTIPPETHFVPEVIRLASRDATRRGGWSRR